MNRKPVPSIAEQLAAAGVSPRDVRLPGQARRKVRSVRQPTTIAAGPTVWLWAMFGPTTAHLFAEGVKGDATGYVSRCGRVQRSRLIAELGGCVVRCELCKAKEEG